MPRREVRPQYREQYGPRYRRIGGGGGWLFSGISVALGLAIVAVIVLTLR